MEEKEAVIVQSLQKDAHKAVVGPSALQDTLMSNEPLYVVDGKKQHSMEGVKAETVESINVIKGDGATNLYGDEGKHGVILVTTKKASQDPVVHEVSRPDNKISVRISTDSLQLSANLENHKEDKEPVVMGIKNNKVTSMGGADENVLIYVDGEKLTKNELSQLDPDNIDAMTVFKGKSAIERYGEEGKDGVIEITTKSKN